MPEATAPTTLAADVEDAVMALWRGLLQHVDDGLSRTSASVLTTLCDGPRRITELATAQSVAQPTMTVAVQRLEARGLVVRERDPRDRRATNVAITDLGRETLARRRATRAALLDERLAALDPAAREALTAALPALRALTPSSSPDPDPR
ncbi:MAG TPA: MarR family transcriptional regulator [Baekduia sp.]|nr:MarR family transcriptional regulator [Baekduia sp.]